VITNLIVVLMLLLRWLVGGCFIVAGLRKVVRPYIALPVRSFLEGRLRKASAFGRLIGGIEVLLGGAVYLGALHPAAQVAVFVGSWFAAVSVVGSILLLRTGSCGCGLPFGTEPRVALLWIRNAILFGAAGIASVEAPALGHLLREGRPGPVALALAPTIPVCFVAAAPWLASRLRLASGHAARDRAPHTAPAASRP
jgi:hypothetical protein